MILPIITEAEVRRGAAEHWRQQYQNAKGEWLHQYGGDKKKAIYQRLLDLGPDPRKEDIDAAIGNSSWGSLICGSCRQEVPWVAVQDVNGGEYSQYLCGQCMKDTIAAAESTQ